MVGRGFGGVFGGGVWFGGAGNGPVFWHGIPNPGFPGLELAGVHICAHGIPGIPGEFGDSGARDPPKLRKNSGNRDFGQLAGTFR